MALPGDPATIEAVASDLDGKARRLADVGEHLRRSVRHTTWEGRKADRFRQSMEHRCREIFGQVEHLHGIARRLRQQAEAVRREIADLRNLENRVRTWLWYNTPADGSVPEWRRWGVSHYFPGSGDTQWREIAATLRRHGARV